MVYAKFYNDNGSMQTKTQQNIYIRGYVICGFMVPMQRWFEPCAKPMRDVVAKYRRLSLVARKVRIITDHIQQGCGTGTEAITEEAHKSEW